MNYFRTVLIILVLSLFLYATGQQPVAAQEEEGGLQLEAEAGFDGYYKEGYSWVPVRVTVSNNGPAVEGFLQVETASDTGTQLIFQAPVTLPTQSNKEVTLYAYVSGYRDTLQVLLVDESGDTLLEDEAELEHLSGEALLYAVVSDEPAPLAFLEDVAGLHPRAAAALMQVEELPPAGAAWNALDVVVLTNVDSGRLTPEQQAALRGWISTGGQLVVTGGPNWQATTSGVAELLPVTVTGVQSVEDVTALHSISAQPFRDPGPYVIATGQLRNGELLLYEDELPLLARQQYGSGAVYFLALDPALAPLVDWRGSAALWTEVAERTPRLPLWAYGVQNGYSAAAAVSRLPSLALPSAFWLFLFLAAYVAVVGPLNYLLLRRMGHREWAWFTIPAVIVLFSLVAYLTGFRLRGNNVILNQMSIAYGHVDGEQARTASVLGIYSPRRATYDVLLPAEALAYPFDQDFGGLGSDLQAVSWSNNVVLEQVRVDVSGVETFVAHSYQPQPAIDGRAVLQLQGNTASLDLTVQNNSDFLLENAGVLFGNTFITLGDLAPGDSSSISESLSSQQASAAGSPYGSPYYPGSAQLSAYYPEMLGTTDYTSDPEVYPRYQLLEALANYSPVATNITQNRATLVAWSEQPQLKTTLVDGAFENRNTTLYFLELPLEQVTAGGQDVSVPLELLNWRVLADSGLYLSGLTGFYMDPGWIELEFEPTSLFEGLDVTGLELVLRRPSEQTGTQPPATSLWNWNEETWVTVPNVVWGRLTVQDFAAYVGVQNRVRLRLQNNQGYGIEISEFYPVLTGDLE